MSTPTETKIDYFSAGIIVIASAIVSIIAVAMDSGATGHDPASILQSLVDIRGPHAAVHVVAMACVGGLTYGFVRFSQLLGINRTSVMLGLVAYIGGSVLMLLATLIDGFVSTDAAAMFLNQPPEVMTTGLWIIRTFSRVVLNDAAKVAWVFQSVAVSFWAAALMRERGLKKLAGVIGFVAGTAPAGAVLMVSNMDAGVVVGILLLQAIWNLTAGIVLMRSKSNASDTVRGLLQPAYSK